MEWPNIKYAHVSWSFGARAVMCSVACHHQSIALHDFCQPAEIPENINRLITNALFRFPRGAVTAVTLRAASPLDKPPHDPLSARSAASVAGILAHQAGRTSNPRFGFRDKVHVRDLHHAERYVHNGRPEQVAVDAIQQDDLPWLRLMDFGNSEDEVLDTRASSVVPLSDGPGRRQRGREVDCDAQYGGDPPGGRNCPGTQDRYADGGIAM
jgi:hypothetical protein